MKILSKKNPIIPALINSNLKSPSSNNGIHMQFGVRERRCLNISDDCKRNYPLERVGFAEGKGGVCNPPERVWL